MRSQRSKPVPRAERRSARTGKVTNKERVGAIGEFGEFGKKLLRMKLSKNKEKVFA